MTSKKRLIIAIGLVLLVMSVAISGALIYSAAPWLRPDLKTGRTNPMQYYISLPNNWTADKTWPIVVTIDGANKDFLDNIKGFMRARNDLPFIIVTPFVVSNGPNNDHSLYNYSDAVWKQIAQVGVAQFDYDGLMAILNDVRKDYNGQDKFFMSAWSAGGHFTWQMIFNHPEQLAGAALAAANYAGRGINAISTDPSRVHLPIKAFQGDADIYLASLNTQWSAALSVATGNGYRNVSRDIIPGQGHSPFPDEVLAFFDSVYTAGK